MSSNCTFNCKSEYFKPENFKKNGAFKDPGLFALFKLPCLPIERILRDKEKKRRNYHEEDGEKKTANLADWVDVEQIKKRGYFRDYEDKELIEYSKNLLKNIVSTIDTLQLIEGKYITIDTPLKELKISPDSGIIGNFIGNLFLHFNIIPVYGSGKIENGVIDVDPLKVENNLRSYIENNYKGGETIVINIMRSDDKQKNRQISLPDTITLQTKLYKLVSVISENRINPNNFNVHVLNPCENQWYTWKFDNKNVSEFGNIYRTSPRSSFYTDPEIQEKALVLIYVPVSELRQYNTNENVSNTPSPFTPPENRPPPPSQPLSQPPENTQLSPTLTPQQPQNAPTPVTLPKLSQPQKQDTLVRQKIPPIENKHLILLPDARNRETQEAKIRNQIIQEFNAEQIRPKRIRVMTYNIGPWDESKFKTETTCIKKAIQDVKPDILGLQEYNKVNDKSTKLLKDILALGFTQQQTCDANQQLQNVILVNTNSSYKIESILGKTGKIDPVTQRCFVMQEFKLTQTPEITFKVYSTHLSINLLERKQNIDSLINIIGNPPPKNVILMGDFNAYRTKDFDFNPSTKVENISALQNLKKDTGGVDEYPTQALENIGYKDTFVQAGAQPPINTTAFGGRIDYIYTSPQFELPLLGTYMYYQKGADHNPIIADFGIISQSSQSPQSQQSQSIQTDDNTQTQQSTQSQTDVNTTQLQQSQPQPQSQLQQSQLETYMPPMKREEVIKQILEFPPKSRGLERKALVETIECKQVCDVLDFAQPSNATPVEVVKSKPQSKGIGYVAKTVVGQSTQNITSNTLRVYKLPSKSDKPVGTLVIIKHNDTVHGTFLKIKKSDEWIKLNDVTDVDRDAESEIFIKGIGQFTIRGLFIPKA